MKLLEAEIVEAFAKTKFRNPIAPLKTSNTKATTASHFDMEPPSWETNPEGLYALPFHNETGICVASRRKTPLDNSPVGGLSRPVRTSSFQFVRVQSKILDRWGQGYGSTTSTRPETHRLDQVNIQKTTPNRGWLPILNAL